MKNLSKALLVLPLLTTLVSCQLFGSETSSPTPTSSDNVAETSSTDSTSSNSDSSSSNSSTTSSGTSVSSNSSNSSSSSNSSNSSSSSSSGSSSSTTTPTKSTPNYQEMKALNGMPNLPSVGDVNLLVIPVVFKGDTSCSGSGTTCANAKVNLDQVFFGETIDNYESVKSYYEKSSYGKLRFDGEVTPVFELSKTLNEYARDSSTRQGRAYYLDNDKFDQQLESITGSALRNFVGSGTTYNGKDYDNDGDGLVDGVWYVYLYDYNDYDQYDTYADALETWLWAFTYWNWNDSIQLGTYAWASYSFTERVGYEDGNGNSVPDGHTFIHETGHMLGLDDYYDYDGTTTPAGGLDMMDYNILDHNAFSKYVLGWAEPTEITSTGTYTLKPFQEDGEFYLIGTTWNGTYYDQFVVIEYYTPTGLNTLDSSEKYDEGLRGFTENGVKIYLVDNRVGKVTYSTYSASWDGRFLDSFTEDDYTDTVSVEPIYSNTRSYSYDPDVYRNNGNGVVHPLLRLIEASGSTQLITPTKNNSPYASNSSLFQQGDTFGNNFSFYGGASFDCLITIGECSSTGTTLTVSAK